MDGFLKKQLKEWTLKKIIQEPKEFGGDFGNALIMYEYLKDFYNDASVSELEPQLMSILSTISRQRNKLLEKNPQFDHRTKFLPKAKEA